MKLGGIGKVNSSTYIMK